MRYAAKAFASIFCLATLVAYGQPIDKDLSDMVETERAFSADTVKLGFRDGFIKYFADDGIGFGPHPERTKEVLQKRPAPTGPRTVIFKWTPIFGDISAAGDLGYTTGPVLYTDVSENPRPPRHAMYFSVWQKQADGTWKVAVDMGVSVPQAAAPITTEFTPLKPDAAKRKFAVLDTKDLADLESRFTRYIGEHGMAKAYAKWLDRSQFRIHRQGKMPIVREDDLSDVLKFSDNLEFIGGKVARSNDLAFTYGKYTLRKSVSETETGYYVHVWRRNAGGDWKLVADIQNPLPKSQ